MMRFWKSITGNKNPDPSAVAKLLESEERLAQIRSQDRAVNDLTEYLAERRQQNHFGDALTISFTPRRRHA